MTGSTVLSDPAGPAVAPDPARPRRPGLPVRSAAPADLPDGGTPPAGAEFRFSSPAGGIVAHGARVRLDVPTWDGPTVARAARDLLARGARDRGAGDRRSGDAGPVLVGAVPFDPARPAHLVLPDHHAWQGRFVPGEPSARALGARVGGAERAVPDARPVLPAPGRDDANFRAAVGRAVERLEAGAAEKVVLARALDVRADAPVDRAALRAALRAANPEAYVFDVELPDAQGHLVGASPELLVSVRDGYLRSRPLAGSAPRSGDLQQDRLNARRLLDSEKDLREHAFVVDAIRTALRDHVTRESDLDVPERPSLVATSHLWHLGTDVRARLRPGTSVLDVVYALHPTPAVCGHPRAAARELIDALEPFDRGYYAGLVGWVDEDGDGEWAIVLRCGVVRGADVRLFGGAGVVVGSTPEAEHAETAVKLSTFLSALGGLA